MFSSKGPKLLCIQSNFPPWTHPSPVDMLCDIGVQEDVSVDGFVRMWYAQLGSMTELVHDWMRKYIEREHLQFSVCVEQEPIFYLRTLGLYHFLAIFHAQERCESLALKLESRCKEKSEHLLAAIRQRQEQYHAHFHCMPMKEDTHKVFLVSREQRTEKRKQPPASREQRTKKTAKRKQPPAPRVYSNNHPQKKAMSFF